ncbi:MAG: MerR family transcriptional regulator [Caldilineae bacterium]|nr:MAG: MerR family transcriptional regulator [Caldilineae bacterium]
MQIDESAQTFNLGVVIRETGLKADTIRAWERRYGLPSPGRTSGGHRLYSQRDIDTLKWLAARRAEGLTISRAVRLWRQLESEAKDPLVVMPLAESGVAGLAARVKGDVLDEIRRNWLDACLAFDEPGANATLAQAHALYPAEIVALNVIRAAMAEIGDRWEAGEISVHQEHFASELATRQLEALIAATPPPRQSGTIAVGCPQHEEHTLSGLIITLLLRRSGQPALFLGANIPHEAFLPALRHLSPRLVIMSAQRLSTAASLARLARTLNEHGVHLAFGGRVFVRNVELRNLVAGYYVGDQLDIVADSVEVLLQAPLRRMELPPVSPAYERALGRFNTRRLQLHARVSELLERQRTFPLQYLETINHFVGEDIRAALELGNLELVNQEILWARSLLEHRQFAPDHLRSYFRAYRQAAEECLGDAGRPILTWLRSLPLNPQE